MTTLRLTVEYDGTDFSGFQWQRGVRTVAGSLEVALSQLLGENVKVTGAGRTDSGVHATGQVISFATRSNFPTERLAIALGATLSPDCSVRDAFAVDEDFSARFSALERTYVYALLNRSARSALLARYAGHAARPLHLDAMRAAATHLCGEHDFRAFATTRPSVSTVRFIRRLAVVRRGDLVRIEIAADGFLHHMVRTMVGTLVDCGLGRRAANEIPAILRSRDRAHAGVTAPARGLYLAGVRYADGYDSFAEPPIFGAPSLA